ncbi:MAG: YIP1 family protein [Proteobacteria bacterium]|nr:YIP1 family protein [Pseudomonadota bacterium]
MTPFLKDLVILSLRDPAEAARQVIAFNLPREVLWTALALMAVLNTLMYSVTSALVPGPSPMPAVFQTPLAYLLFMGGALVLVSIALYWAGRSFGGTGSLDDILSVIIWLQFLRVLVQVVSIVLLLTLPLLAALLTLAAAILGLWIFVHFVDQAHRFGSPLKSVGVIVASFIGMVMGLSILLALFGGGFLGGAQNVL